MQQHKSSARAPTCFGQGFIDFVKLAYSHDADPLRGPPYHGRAPRRQLYVNGYLGPKFKLEPGVAQGCPLSPLLFLIIAEPLSRLINDNATAITAVASATALRCPCRPALAIAAAVAVRLGSLHALSSVHMSAVAHLSLSVLSRGVHVSRPWRGP